MSLNPLTGAHAFKLSGMLAASNQAFRVCEANMQAAVRLSTKKPLRLLIRLLHPLPLSERPV